MGGVLLYLTEIFYLDARIARIGEIKNHELQGGEKAVLSDFNVEIKDVCFSYQKDTQVIRHASFTAEQGQVTALVGPSGCGKTTMLKLISRLYDADSGTVQIGGTDIREIHTDSLFKYVSIVFQEVILFNTSIMENIRLGRLDASDEEVIRAAKLAGCNEFVSRLPDTYQTIIGENGTKLSGGERQRLSIARAILKDAPIIILDEIAASLDVETEVQIQTGLNHLIQGKTVIVISHRLKSIENADKIVVMKAGTVLKRPQAIIGLCLIAIVIVIAIAAPAFSPHDPELVNLSQKYAQPDAEYPLGTDQLGRCTLSRLLYGARYSIGISLPVLLILSVIGLIVGTFSACAGEKADHFITILCDVFIAFPSLIIAIAVIGVLGNGLQNIAVSVVIATWAWFVRVVRSYSVQEMGKDYILAARISGCNTGKLVFRHLIPNILPQFLVYVSTGVASSIIMVSSFAFLGLGLPSGTPEWGAMLNDARTALYSHPELLIYPGLCIFVTAAGFNLFGEALRDILTPEEDSL